MTKRKRKRKRKPKAIVECTVELTAQLQIYIDYLVQGGLHGNNRGEVIQRMFLDGLRAAVPIAQVANAVKNGTLGKSEQAV